MGRLEGAAHRAIARAISCPFGKAAYERVRSLKSGYFVLTARMRRTEVRPMFSLRAISALLTPAQ